jgi:hypothetical protein
MESNPNHFYVNLAQRVRVSTLYDSVEKNLAKKGGNQWKGKDYSD